MEALELPKAYGEFLSESYIWDYFGTLTLRNEYSRVGDRIFRGHVHRMMWRWFMLSAVRVGGADQVDPESWRFQGKLATAYKHGRGRFVYAFAIEPHRSKQLHGHFLLYVPRYFNHLLDYGDGVRAWEWGYCKFERPECQEDVSTYVSKYISKGGDITLSESFESSRLWQGMKFAAIVGCG